MMNHVIYGYFGSEDKPTLNPGDGVKVTLLNLLGSDGYLGHGIGNVVDDLAKLGVFPSQIGIELLVLAAHVQAADTRISRSTGSEDSWTRKISVVVPVTSDVNRWERVSTILTRALDFLTGDLWDIRFRASSYNEALVKEQAPLETQTFDSISLFSGGLDSLIGAIDLLEQKENTLFVSHASDGATSAAQYELFDGLKVQYENLNIERIRLWMSFPKNLVEDSQPEMTMRSRSFLFFALGVAAGTGLEHKFKLFVPENGLIALNVPLDPLRMGSHSTHTTHPFYMARWNELLVELGIDGELTNPYWDKTKGEMVGACANKQLLSDLISTSLSCSSPSKGRWSGKSSEHCGYCVPCIIRRAAIKASSLNDNTPYSLDNLQGQSLNTLVAEGKQIRSFQFALSRLQAKPELAKYLIYNAGPLLDLSSTTKYGLSDVYTRGLLEVSKLLEGVETKPIE